MMEKEKISTGSYDLNRWLYGGYDKNIITTLYGDAGTGKSNFCMLVAVSQAKKGNKVLFIDTEGGFSIERIKQLAGELYEYVIKNIILLNVHDFAEQKKVFASLIKNFSDVISLIIVDGMTILYRLALADAEGDEKKIREINAELARQLKILSEITRIKNIPVIITNQTYQEFLSLNDKKSGKKPESFMVGGDILKYWSKCIIELKNEGGRRKAILRKHRSLKEKKLDFQIVDNGIKKRGWL